MSATNPSPTPADSPAPFSPSPPPNGQGSTVSGTGSIPPLSLVLYIFSVTLILFLLVIGAFVSRSVRRRRRAAAIALPGTGAYGPSTGFRGKFDRHPGSKPVMWEAHITPPDDEAKGWTGIFPVAGETLVPVTDAPAHDLKSKSLTSWRSRLRFQPHRNHRPDIAEQSPTTIDPSPESPPPLPPPPLEPVDLTVLISMPTPLVHTKAGHDDGGPPVVELGVTQVAYTPNLM